MCLYAVELRFPHPILDATVQVSLPRPITFNDVLPP